MDKVGQAAGGPGGERATVHLVLYVSATARASHVAEKTLRGLAGRFGRSVSYEVLDITAAFERAEVDQVIYAPTLVKQRPEPRAWFVGDLGDGGAVLSMLQLHGLEESE